MPAKKRSTTTKRKKSLFSNVLNGRNPWLAAVIVLAVSAMGYFGYVQSNADTFNGAYSVAVSSEFGCKLSGRVWSNNDCKDECRSNQVEFKKTDGTPKRGYCTSYVNIQMTPAECIGNLHRYFITGVGCSRRANQENTNQSPQCIPGYPNYVAEKTTDRCIPQVIANANTGAGAGQVGSGTPTGQAAPVVTTPSGGTTTPSTTPAPAPTPPVTNTSESCRLLGRQWNAAKKTCTTTCQKDAGVLVVGTVTGVKYCNKAIAASAAGNAETCVNKLHRVWLVEGCAKRPNQDDAERSSKEALLQCQAGFNFYNANFKNKAEDKATLTDVCEISKKVSTLNETNGTPGVPAQVGTNDSADDGTASGGNSTGSNSGTTDETTGDFRITVYEDANFKGKSKTFTLAQAKMPEGWNDKVSSFKILKGRWQICADKDFNTNCSKRWASEADLSKVDNKAKIQDNEISSLQPVTVTVFEEAPADVVAACANAAGQVVPATEDNLCPVDATLACPATYVLQAGECKEQIISPASYAPVDPSFKGKKGELDCSLLGREWIAKQKNKDVNGGNYGCSEVSCNLAIDGAPRNNDGSPYCVSAKFDAPYAVKMDQKECSALHRVWIKQVARCAQVPNRKDKDQTVVNAKQCVGDYSVYYMYKLKGTKAKTDECFKPDFFKRAQGVVKTTGGILGAALQQGPKSYCNTVKGGGYHWNKQAKRCDKDRPPAPISAPGSTGGNGQDPQMGNDGTNGTTGTTTSSVNCAELGRPQDGRSSCKRSCLKSGYVLTNYSDPTKWDRCVPDVSGSDCPTAGCDDSGGYPDSPAPSTPQSKITIYGLDNGGASTRTLYSSAGGLGDNPNTASVSGSRSWAVCGTPNDTYPRSGGTFYANQDVVCTKYFGAGSYSLSAVTVYVAGKTSSTCQVSSCKVSQYVPAWTLNNVSVQ